MAGRYPRKGGPYWHVIRFLDHPLLPANTNRDVPKIIKHGINDDGPMHPKSPHVSAPDGVVTLLYKMDREDWLQKFLDVDGTLKFTLRIKRPNWSKDLYVVRNHRAVEIGLLSQYKDEPPVPSPAIRYVVSSNGDWKPISQCDINPGQWCGTDIWVRGQAEAIAKAIWYDKRWNPGDEITEITWSGMTNEEREAADNFVKQWKVKPPSKGYNDWDRLSMNMGNMSKEEHDNELYRLLDIQRRECRGGCGTKDAKQVCSKCKETYYCSRECQIDDWKWHKSVCGQSDGYSGDSDSGESDSGDSDSESDLRT